MNAKTLIPLAAGLGIGGFALWMGFNTLKNARGSQHAVPTVEVWAAKADIPRGTEVTEQLVNTLPYPATLIPSGAFKDKEQLLGRVVRVDAPAGLPILESMVLAPGARAGLFVKPGLRAVGVKIDEGSGVDFHLEPGCFVDVVGSFQIRRDGRQETVARTIVENVEVAAVGQRLSPVQGGEVEDKAGKRTTVRAVTLFVEPDDVPKLLLAEEKGRIKLGLRNDADSGRMASNQSVSDRELTGEATEHQAPTNAATAPTLMDRLRGMLGQAPSGQAVSLNGATLPADAALAAAQLLPTSLAWEVAVYRGQQKETIRFKNRDSRELAKDTGKGRAAARGSPAEPVSLSDTDDQTQSVEPEPKERQE